MTRLSSCHVYRSSQHPYGVVYFCIYCEHSTRSDDSRDCVAFYSDKTGILYRCHALCQRVFDNEEYAKIVALLNQDPLGWQPRYILRRQKLLAKRSMQDEV